MSAPWWDSDYNGRSGSGQESRVYVGNLPYSSDERSLKDSFANYGAVSSESKSASDAIHGMNGQNIGGCNVTVQEAQPRSRR